MKKFFRINLSAIALMFVFNVFAVVQVNAQSINQKILNLIDAHNKALTSLKADVTMVKYNAQLEESDTTTGKTMYLPKTAKQKMYARINWETPVVEEIAVIDREYTLYRPRLNQVIRGTTDKSKNNATVGGALAFMSMSKSQLKANYEVTYLGEEKIKGGIPTFHIQLTPKSKTTYKSAELWVDGNGMPLQAKVIENNNDSTTVLLENLKKNETLNAIIFTINVPKNVKEVKS